MVLYKNEANRPLTFWEDVRANPASLGLWVGFGTLWGLALFLVLLLAAVRLSSVGTIVSMMFGTASLWLIPYGIFRVRQREVLIKAELLPDNTYRLTYLYKGQEKFVDINRKNSEISFYQFSKVSERFQVSMHPGGPVHRFYTSPNFQLKDIQVFGQAYVQSQYPTYEGPIASDMPWAYLHKLAEYQDRQAGRPVA